VFLLAKFTETEQKIIDKYIHDEKLHTSLRLIRECMEELWRPDAPRIVQDFTDHGEQHSERLVCYVDQLLKARNYVNDLHELEMYLLLAGIYLHDIGMQCDVNKHPGIKEKAEKLDVKFNLNFTANTSSKYSLEEQKSIRENHHYLSAAWISYAFITKQTVVSSAVETVRDDLINDLMDVCKYHSKLEIIDCSNNFLHHSNMRKKLVAALLRFADELDIDGSRVSLKTVENFSFNPQNSLYWCIHKNIKIRFKNENLVNIEITLNPEDKKLYGELIKQEFIEKFKRKNENVLDVLAYEGFPIRIDSNSSVVEDEHIKKLLSDVKSVLDSIKQKQQNNAFLTYLAENVKTWLFFIEYNIIEFKTFDERTIDILAISPFEQQYLIRCIRGEISEEDVVDLAKILNRKTQQGWLISEKLVSSKARKCAGEDDSLEVFTLDEFKKRKVFAPHYDFHESYIDISNPEFLKYEEQIIRTALNELNNLRYHKQTGELTIRAGHNWAVPVLNNLQEEDYVKAVTFLQDDIGEWGLGEYGYGSTLTWNDYIVANLTAAKNCKFVKRIFITDEAKLNKYLYDPNDNIVKKHSITRFEETKLNGIFVNKKHLKSMYPDLLDAINDGFILISSNGVKIAIINKFKNVGMDERRYTVRVTYNTKEIENIEKAFDSILAAPSGLCSEIK
jgi:hypothetical protein